MTKTLELLFLTEDGRTSRVSIESPTEPINIEEVKSVMEQVIEDNVFHTDYGDFIAIKSARLVERQVTEYDLT